MSAAVKPAGLVKKQALCASQSHLGSDQKDREVRILGIVERCPLYFIHGLQVSRALCQRPLMRRATLVSAAETFPPSIVAARYATDSRLAGRALQAFTR